LRVSTAILAVYHFLALACPGLQGLLPSREEAQAHAQALNDIAPDSAPSVLKERGLYVDMRQDDIYTSSQLEDGEATVRDHQEPKKCFKFLFSHRVQLSQTSYMSEPS
jgi:hypothetical protein